MSDEQVTFKPVRRTTKPYPKASEHGSGASAWFGISPEPEHEWRMIFEQNRFETIAQIVPGGRRSHPGVIGSGPGINFGVPVTERMPALVAALDDAIEDTNEKFREAVLPGRQAKADEAAQLERARIERQAELDRVADELAPPGDESTAANRPAPRIPTRTPNPRW